MQRAVNLVQSIVTPRLDTSPDLPLRDVDKRNLALVETFLELCLVEVTARVDRTDLGVRLSFPATAMETMQRVEGTMSAAEALIALDAMLRDMNMDAKFLTPTADEPKITIEPLTHIGVGTPSLLQRKAHRPLKGASGFSSLNGRIPEALRATH